MAYVKRENKKEDEEHPDKKHRKWVIFIYFGEGTNSWQNCLRIQIEEYLAKQYCWQNTVIQELKKIRVNWVKGDSINTFALIVRWKTPEKLKLNTDISWMLYIMFVLIQKP